MSPANNEAARVRPDDAPQRPLRIVFALLHAGYLRHYGDPIRILCAHGHSVHLALYTDEAKDRGDDRLLERLLSDCPAVTVAQAPRRPARDGWRPLAGLVRSLTDVLRYAEPRYADAGALRDRAIDRLRARVRAGRIDPLSRRVALRVLDWTTDNPDVGRARRLMRILNRIEDAIPTSAPVESLLKSYRADVVLASPVVEFGSPQVEFVKAAVNLRIPCAVCVASWDNLTNKGLLRVIPDRVLVWNDIQRRELEQMHGVPADRVVLTGGQKFDPWFDLEPSRPRTRFLDAAGLPDAPYLVYLCSSNFIAPDEVSFVRRWISALRASEHPRIRELAILVRPHPQNALQWSSVDLSDLGAVSVWPRDGEYPDEGEAQADFYDSIAYSAGVVGVNTTAQIEAGIIGKPVYAILDPQFAATQAGTLHFHYLLHENGGFVREASSLDQHIEQLAVALDDTSGAEAEVHAFIARFVRPLGADRPANPIVAAAVEDLARLRPSGRPKLPLRSWLIRAALYPVAAAIGLGAVARQSQEDDG